MSGDKAKLISGISWLILIGYLILTIITITVIYMFDWARSLFTNTEVIVKINAVWFSILIFVYGIFALRKNYKRARLSNLAIRLDPQFLLISAFILFSIKEILNLIVFFVDNDLILEQSLNNGIVVLNFGGYVALLGSIYFSRKRK